MIRTLLLVALGGAIGSAARAAVGLAALRLFGPGFPWGTLAVNLAGCLAMGVLAGVLGQHRLAPLVLTGVLGGFTTFSAFALDAAGLWQRGAPGLAILYAAASVGLSLAAVVLGMALARGAGA